MLSSLLAVESARRVPLLDNRLLLRENISLAAQPGRSFTSPGPSDVNSDGKLLAMTDYRDADCFSDLDKLILAYATAISRTPVEVSDELFDALRAHFSTAQLVGLTHVITLGNLRARFNIALDIGSSGFSGNQVCALPEARGGA